MRPLPDQQDVEAFRMGRETGLKEAANWLRRQTNAETDPKARVAFSEAHNAVLQMIAEARHT